MKLIIFVLSLFCTSTLMAQGQVYTVHKEETKKAMRADPNYKNVPDFESKLDQLVAAEFYVVIHKDSFELISNVSGADVDKGSIEGSKDLKKQGDYYNVIGIIFEKNNDKKVAARIEELRLEAAAKKD